MSRRDDGSPAQVGGHQRLSGRDRGEPSDDRDPSTQLRRGFWYAESTTDSRCQERIHRGPPESGSLTAPNTEQWSNAKAFSVGTASSHSPRGRVSSPGAGAKFEPDRSVRFTAARPVPVPAWLGGPAFGPARPVGGRTQMTPFKLAGRSRSHKRPTHRSARRTEATPGDFDERPKGAIHCAKKLRKGEKP